MSLQAFEKVILLDSCLLASLMFTVLYLFGFKRKKRKKWLLQRPIFDTKQMIVIFGASCGITSFFSTLVHDRLTNSFFFVVISLVLPYVLLNEKRRIECEELFDEVVLYCQNTSMLLKQNHNVYASLSTVQNDLTTLLKQDVVRLMQSLDESQVAAIQVMEEMEQKYPYSCINNLNILLVTMQFEDSHIDDGLLFMYQEELDHLQKDIRDNKAKRKTLRIQYLGITMGCLVAYWFFLTQMGQAMPHAFDDDFFSQLNTVYILLNMMTLLVVDTYFNASTTKE